MTTLLPQDSDNNTIPALRLRSGSGAHGLTFSSGGTSVRNTTAFNGATRVVSLYATVPVYVKFGDSSVTATTSDHYFPGDVYYDFAIGGDRTGQYTHVAVRSVSAGGVLYVSEKF